MVKRFLDWIHIKQKIHETESVPLYFKEGDIWWCSVGENVGVEMNGKGDTFSRPVFVYRKLSKNGFLGVPLTTKRKQGTWFVQVTFQEKKITANVAQVRVYSASRMLNKMGTLDEVDADTIKSGFLRLYS
jgi:mRNA interferase MazF